MAARRTRCRPPPRWARWRGISRVRPGLLPAANDNWGLFLPLSRPRRRDERKHAYAPGRRRTGDLGEPAGSAMDHPRREFPSIAAGGERRGRRQPSEGGRGAPALEAGGRGDGGIAPGEGSGGGGSARSARRPRPSHSAPPRRRYLEHLAHERALAAHTLRAYRGDLDRSCSSSAATGSPATRRRWSGAGGCACVRAFLGASGARGLASAARARPRRRARPFRWAVREGELAGLAGGGDRPRGTATPAPPPATRRGRGGSGRSDDAAQGVRGGAAAGRLACATGPRRAALRHRLRVASWYRSMADL